ncbi:uncharacterized protein LOC135923142 [Gordionus sp. m RMFG-2023]|uniref:uncharacterized protein LOC135923142 n=1 Tax=Gordionus sp. m RMFG-2023 TaxID=3053472 RepID=UPI0031FCD891
MSEDTWENHITDIPGFYYDPKTKKHYKIQAGHNNFNPIPKCLVNQMKQSKQHSENLNALIFNKFTANILIHLLKRQIQMIPFNDMNLIKTRFQNIVEYPKSFVRLKSAEIFQKRTNISDLYLSPLKDYIISTSRAFGMNISEKYQKLDNTLSSLIDEEGFVDSYNNIFPYGIDGPQTLRVVNSFSNLRFYDYAYATPPICHRPYRFYVSSYGFDNNRPFEEYPGNMQAENNLDNFSDPSILSERSDPIDNFHPAILCSDWHLNAPYVITKRMKSIDTFCINPVKPILACVCRDQIHFLDLLTLSARDQCSLLSKHQRISMESNEELLSDVLSSTFSEDGCLLLLGTRKGSIEIVDVKTAQDSTKIVKTKQMLTLSVKISFDIFPKNYNRTMDDLINSNDETKFIDSIDSSQGCRINQKNYSICDMKFVPGDNYHLLTSHYGDKLLMWDLRLSKIVLSYPGHCNSHKYVRVNCDLSANIVYCGGTDKIVRIWTLWGAEPLKILKFTHPAIINPLSFLANELEDDEIYHYHHSSYYPSHIDHFERDTGQKEYFGSMPSCESPPIPLYMGNAPWENWKNDQEAIICQNAEDGYDRTHYRDTRSKGKINSYYHSPNHYQKNPAFIVGFRDKLYSFY